MSCAPATDRLAALRYDHSKRRARGLVETIRRYRPLPPGDRLRVVFLKLFDRIA